MTPSDVDPVDARQATAFDRAAEAARFADLTRLRQTEVDAAPPGAPAVSVTESGESAETPVLGTTIPAE